MTQIHLRAKYLTLLHKGRTAEKHEYHGMPRQLLEHIMHCLRQDGTGPDEVRVTVDNELLFGPIDRQGLTDLLFRRDGKFNGPPVINLSNIWMATLQGAEREDGSGRKFNLALSLPEHGGVRCTMYVELED